MTKFIRGKKIIKRVLLVFIIFLFIFGCYLFIGKTEPAEEIAWGVNFSQKQAQNLRLDWKESYLALLDDLGAKDIKLASYWDLIETEEGKYNFEDLDWQIKEAEKRGVKILLVMGMKNPRWPECHIPAWANDLDKEKQQAKILNLIEKIILRYRDSSMIKYWQVENEPFFPFGDCPWKDRKFLIKEIELVKQLDTQKRPVIISDSGEGSLWIAAARVGDIVGTTMYEKVWFRQFKAFVRYPFPPTFYGRRAQIIKTLFNKEVICIEFQAEPWCPQHVLADCSLEEQRKTMSLEQFKKNIEFAKKTGLKEFYLWGGEWWYWMKTKQNQPEIWNEAKKLF